MVPWLGIHGFLKCADAGGAARTGQSDRLRSTWQTTCKSRVKSPVRGHQRLLRRLVQARGKLGQDLVVRHARRTAEAQLQLHRGAQLRHDAGGVRQETVFQRPAVIGAIPPAGGAALLRLNGS